VERGEVSLRRGHSVDGASAVRGHAAQVLPISSPKEFGISWGESTTRVTAYWHALGVNDEEQLTALTRRVMQRVDALGTLSASADLATLAIEETRKLLDEWLSTVLSGASGVPAEELAMARAALLSGAVSGWTAALLRNDHYSLAVALRRVLPIAVPASAEFPMPIGEIKLFSLNYCWRALAARLVKLLRFFRRSQ
jgi:hypothetical protein